MTNPVYHAVEFAIIDKDGERDFGLVCAYPAQIITGSNGEAWAGSQRIDLGYVQAQARALREYQTLEMLGSDAIVRVVTRADGVYFKGDEAPSEIEFSAVQDYATEQEALGRSTMRTLRANKARKMI